jgi:hypothetical protein
MSAPDLPMGTYAISPRVKEKSWQSVRAGDQIDGRIKLELTVYIPPIDGDELESHVSDPPPARVLLVDPSYRILTLQYPSGASQAYKVGMRVPLHGIMPGSWVAFHPVAVTRLHPRRHRDPSTGACARTRVPSSP